jgi:hypothetical protein
MGAPQVHRPIARPPARPPKTLAEPLRGCGSRADSSTSSDARWSSRNVHAQLFAMGHAGSRCARLACAAPRLIARGAVTRFPRSLRPTPPVPPRGFIEALLQSPKAAIKRSSTCASNGVEPAGRRRPNARASLTRGAVRSHRSLTSGTSLRRTTQSTARSSRHQRARAEAIPHLPALRGPPHPPDQSRVAGLQTVGESLRGPDSVLMRKSKDVPPAPPSVFELLSAQRRCARHLTTTSKPERRPSSSKPGASTPPTTDLLPEALNPCAPASFSRPESPLKA